MKLSRIRFAFPWRIALILALLPCLPIARLLGMVSVGTSATSAVLSGGILAQFRDCKSTSCSDSNPMAHGDGSGP
jgi:hypothetical protein